MEEDNYRDFEGGRLMNQEFQQLNDIKNVSHFRRVMSNNDLIKSLPQEITQAVLDKDLPLDSLKEIVKLNDYRINKKVIEVIQRKKKYEKNIVNTAKFAIKKSNLMKKKMEKLKKLLDQDIILSTVWDIGKRENYAGDPSFHGNAPTQVVEQCILRLTKPKDIILDPMAGSGTTIDVCKTLDRRCIAYDLNPIRLDIVKNDSRNLPLKTETVDFVFLHPPYWNLVSYSRYNEDLSKQSFENFLKSIEEILIESKRVLKKEKYISILIGDLTKNGEFIPLTRKIANMAESIGFKDCGQAIKITSNSTSQIRRGKTIYAELANTQNLKINHDYVMFWKK